MARTLISLGRQTDLDAQGSRLTGLGDGIGAQDAVTKAQLDIARSGLDAKDSVRAATLVTGSLASSFANGAVIDGITLVTDNRILIKNQSNAAENGIYKVNATGAPTRATDADSSEEVTPQMYVMVEEGTQANTGWTLSNTGTITVGTTPLTFVQFNAPSTVIGGAGIVKTGNTLDVVSGNGAIIVNPDNISLVTADASLTINGSGVKVTPGTPGTIMLTNGSNIVAATALSGDVQTITGAGVVTLSSAIQRVSNIVTREVPTGAINNSNKAFALAATPVVGSEEVYLNGLLQNVGATNDYTISGANITYVTAPRTGDVLLVSYRK